VGGKTFGGSYSVDDFSKLPENVVDGTCKSQLPLKDPNVDTQQVVVDIVGLNQLDTATLQPGQRLAIPADYSK
jgi:hypothetical protein